MKSSGGLNVTNMTILTLGIILIWAALKDVTPPEVIKQALKGKTVTSPLPVPAPTPTPKGPASPGTNPNNGVGV
jgi:hypothetical protein